ncbi:MAG: hypothetical protein GWN71_23100, partial [Gammaproteobacteria bacterium]|nr:hypothetical protein [Gemmatimonadota bacterium]NIU76341.1 hypothetical protein [Gammaproteobacteria bacterium]
MFRQMLYVDWKATRLALLPFVVAAFALPLLSVQGGVVPGDVPGRYRASMILSQLGLW